ncbi:hypothetical protein FKM82_001497 [Ascaphus truei]
MVTMDNAEENAGPKGLQLIGRLPATQCPQFLHRVIDGVCGRAQPRFQDYGNVWNLREWLDVLEDATAFLKTSTGKDDTSEELGLSSDKLSTLQMPLVNLDLDITQNGDIKPVSIEMNKEELQNLINSLEAANKVVLQLK